MITLKIGNAERKGSDIEERWIAQQIRKRREDGQPICIKMVINIGEINVVLTSRACSGGSGGGRNPNRKERKLFELWKERGLKGQDINVGMLVSFLRQYGQYVN